MQPSTAPFSARRAPRKNLMLLGNVALFALSSGGAGMLVGALVGLANYFSTPSWAPDGSGMFRRQEWWEVVRFCTLANGIFMSILGVLVGLIIWVCIGSASSRWNSERKERFSQGVKTRLLLPLAITIVVASPLATVIWCLWHGGVPSPLSSLGNVMEWTGVAMLPLGACLWTLLLVRSSKRLPQEPVSTGRLLPID